MASSTDTLTASSPVTYNRPRSHRSAPGTTQERTTAALAANGRRAALEAFYNDLFTLDGDAAATMERVQSGTAPQAFKDAFCDTLVSLSAMFDQKI